LLDIKKRRRCQAEEGPREGCSKTELWAMRFQLAGIS